MNALISGRTGTICKIISMLESPFTEEGLYAINHHAKTHRSGASMKNDSITGKKSIKDSIGKLVINIYIYHILDKYTK